MQAAAGLPDARAVHQAQGTLRGQHDDQWGGFGAAPKFPQAMSHELLLQGGLVEPVVTSLDCMASGGIYDHLGGGFARYSVDGTWLAPHFEKMLYDNALLTRLYLHGWQITGEARVRQVVDETLAYVLRDLRHASGGFYSAEDADSEGEEGKFYVWSIDEVLEVGGQAAVDWYGVTAEGNFEGENILNRISERGDLLRPPEVEHARQRLFERREGRIRPGLDDKVLTEWNALMLAALAEAAAATGDAAWLDAAVANGEFLLANLRRPDGRWLRSWQSEGGANHLAYAADHGALVDAFTRLAEATGQARWIDAARTTADAMLELFWDDDQGGLFTTGHDAEKLITRGKDLMDNATPGANSLAAVALLRLAALTGNDAYRDRGEAILRLLAAVAVQHPTAFGHLLTALDLATAGTTEIVVAGDRPDLVGEVHHRYLPTAVLAWGERYDSPLWADREDGRAYVCQGYTCKLPASTVGELREQLDG
jgi:uncharacterized protein YyaL (SSP411 family)